MQWNIKKLCFEYDTEPYYQALDATVKVILHVDDFFFGNL